ncbi:MAG: GTP 3',8-cyclase MoaA [Verrucomicrobia bacterium]|nr:GTP 3',8-cyclase MoaA [Verrucomicrobiota bacterium]
MLRQTQAQRDATYARASAQKGVLDQHNRHINYLRVSLTDVCNLRCVYCMPEDMSFRPQPQLLTHDEFRTLILSFADLGFQKIRYTGGEPTLFKSLPQLIREVQDAAPGLVQAITTNGIMLSHLARPLRDAGLKRVNISIDTLDGHRFRRITRWGNLADVMRGIEAAEQAGLEIKLNCVVVRGLNDQEDVIELARLTLDKPWQVRYIELMPFGAIHEFQRSHIVSEEELCAKISSTLGRLELQHEGRLDGEAKIFALPNAKGTLGFISSVTAPFCAGCNRARLTADGKLRLCLLRENEIELKAPLRAGADAATLKKCIREGIYKKPWGHGLDKNEFATNRTMSEIGG